MIGAIQINVSLTFAAFSISTALTMSLDICCWDFCLSTRPTEVEEARPKMTFPFSDPHEFRAAATSPVLLTSKYVGFEVVQWNPWFSAATAIGKPSCSVMLCEVQDIAVATYITDPSLTTTMSLSCSLREIRVLPHLEHLLN